MALAPLRRGAAVALRSAPKQNAVAVRQMGGGGGGVMRPPFVRSPPPEAPLHEEHELIWDDGVAPEVCLDFDAPYISKSLGLKMWLGGFAFFATIFSFASLQPYDTNPAVPRHSEGTMLPFGGAHIALGGDPDEVPDHGETTQVFGDNHGHGDEDEDGDDDDE